MSYRRLKIGFFFLDLALTYHQGVDREPDLIRQSIAAYH